MSGFKLYEINAMLDEAINAAFATADDTGVLPDDWARFLDDVQQERDQKCLDVARYIKSCEAEADAIEAEKKRLSDRSNALYNKCDRLKQYLSTAVQQGEKLSSANCIITWRKSERVEIAVPADQLPDTYKRVKTTIDADKTSIKEAIKRGETIDGCSIVTVHNLQIK